MLRDGKALIITFTKAYKTSDGTTFESLEDAQRSEILAVIRNGFSLEAKGTPLTPELAAAYIMQHAAKVIDILSTTATSKPRARKINGGTKARKKATPAVALPEEAKLATAQP